MSFINWLQEAVSRQVDNTEVADILLLQLAYKYANAGCQAVLAPLKGKTSMIVEYIYKAGQNVGTEAHRSRALAAALGTLQTGGFKKGQQGSKLGFTWGKPGHFQKECRKGTVGTSGTPAKPCPRCGKGLHWASQCESKLDKVGNPLSGNRRRGARPGTLTTPWVPQREAFLSQSSEGLETSKYPQQEVRPGP
uniref:Gag polyprotein n=1 Tax=Molossus molossus TaxID=27622 RepID=A0A7J8CRJ0_MOLMO|nr:hypothetical protein HJG59_009724 [Molossus molossus]